MVGSLLTLMLVLTGCDLQMVTAARFAEAQAQAQSSSGIRCSTSLRRAEEALPQADESTRPIPDADEAFLYGVGIGIQSCTSSHHPREIAMAGLERLGDQADFSLSSADGQTVIEGPGGSDFR